ncbi:MAG: DUF11 domain-containing protein [Candidatus Marinimicrobia bacterium]|nr:DUF11 domain-containing protein [Candidatus Neomarinimicrobiota bacterium]
MKPTRFLTIALILIGLVSMLNAAGTPAGTTISNQALGAYDDANGNEIAGSTEGYLESNTVTTEVSQVAGAALGNDQDLNVSAMSHVLYDVIFTNTGNGEDTFSLALGNITGGQADTYTYEIYSDLNNDGAINGADGIVSTTGAIAADASYNLLIKVADTTAAGAPEGDETAVTLTAVSGFDSDSTDAVVLTTTVQAATVTAEITAHHDGNPQPGDVITYDICITNNGTATAYNLIFTNLIPTNTTYSTGTIREGTGGWTSGTGITDASDSPTDEGDFNITTPNTITVDFGDLAGGGNICVYYKVTIDAGIPEGDPITNEPEINFENEGGTPYPPVDPENGAGGGGDIVISESFGVDIAFIGAVGEDSFTGDPGDSLFYPFTVENLGNGTDNFNLSAASDYVVWTYFLDSNDDGELSAAELAVGAITSTGDLDQNEVGNYVAVGVIPAGTPDTDTDATTFTATSQGDGSETDTDTADATCTAPVLTLVKSVLPPGNQPPGTVLTYTVTVANGGTGTASTVVVSDAIPTNTTYVAESMVIDADDTITDSAGDSDGGKLSGGSVVFEFSTLDETGGTTDEHVLKFQVTID